MIQQIPSEKQDATAPAEPTARALQPPRVLAGAGATVAGLTIVKPELVARQQANSKVKLGLVGCGGRGDWIAGSSRDTAATSSSAPPTTSPTAPRAPAAASKCRPNRCFSGLAGYKRLLDAKPDAIVIESPPYFHPEQALAGVEAGCHVYCAKPIAVDVPGCLTVAEAGRKGTQQKRCVLVDFQTRADPFYQEAIRRVHAGDIGPLVSGEAVYYCGGTWGGADYLVRDPHNPENRIHAWGLDRVLSGDVITEQNIHALDVAAWIVDREPLRAVGRCSRKGRGDPGNCHGDFHVIFTFPDDVLVTFASKQYGTGHDDIGNRMFGASGSLETHYGGIVHIVGQKSYKGGRSPDIYAAGAIRNIATFHAAITKGEFANPTVAPSVRSNLTTILGRTAAYQKAEVTWEQMMKTAENSSSRRRG